MKITAPAPKTTARQNLVTVLAQEILSGTYDPKFPIPSEHQLCRRFGVSRVTVRLALSDLQNRGLIYRHHGKGTFIHSGARLIGKPLAVLMKAPQQEANRSVSLFLQGFQSYLSGVEAYSIHIHQSPVQWTPAMATSLGGVLVVPEGVTAADLDNLHKRNLPYLILGMADLPGPSIRLGTEESVYEAILSLASRGRKRFGYLHGIDSRDNAWKAQGLQKGLTQAGLDSSALSEIACASTCMEISRAAGRLLDQTPAPEVILTAELMHTMAILAEARARGLVVGKDVQVICFVDQAPDNTMDPSVIMIQLPHVEGGKKAAEALCRSSASAQPVDTLSLPYQIHWTAGAAQTA